MAPKVYIEGQAGTAALPLRRRLSRREDITLLTPEAGQDRKSLMNGVDLVVLCLPEEEARQAAALVENPETRIVDISAAHRTAEGWTYGLPELEGQRAAIAKSKRVALPGAHATGFISCAAPLVRAGLLPRDAALTCFSLTGYSQGGQKLIDKYETDELSRRLFSPGLYSLEQEDGDLAEMQTLCGLAQPPVFSPVVAHYLKGMATTVPFHMSQLTGGSTLRQVWEALNEAYAGEKLVTVAPLGAPAGGTLYANTRMSTDVLELFVAGNEERFTITALLDNLGKGAAGAAIQNMNLMLGLPEDAGLRLEDR